MKLDPSLETALHCKPDGQQKRGQPTQNIKGQYTEKLMEKTLMWKNIPNFLLTNKSGGL